MLVYYSLSIIRKRKGLQYHYLGVKNSSLYGWV